MPVSPGLRMLKQKDLNLKASLGYTATPCHTKQDKTSHQNNNNNKNDDFCLELCPLSL